MRMPQEALAEILSVVTPLGAEQVELSAALGRVLSQAVRAGRSLPPWDNSAMDGYAVRAADVVAGAPLPVVGVVAAGHPAVEPLRPGHTLRIMTGAPMPAGADAVIMREEAQEQDGQVRFANKPAPGDHIRRAGEDVQDGEEVLPQGARLGPGELGLLASLGRTLVCVHRRPLVAIVSTGDELVPADQPPRPGQIVGSNAHALAAQVQECGAIPWVLPLVPDDREQLGQAFAQALRADVVLSSGGVSVGEFDYVKDVLRELGVKERFWQVDMKPGKPLSFSVAPQGAPVFGLPGNPASAMVSFELFVRPALLRLLGHGGLAPSARAYALPLTRPVALVGLRAAITPDRRRLHFLRARVERDDRGLWATPASRQGSGMLRSMVGVNALLEIPPGGSPLMPGAEVRAHLLELM
jgi:molybdopterin molybdotransferase